MRRPSVRLKLATSLDGRIATSAGESRWITGEAARAQVQLLRAKAEIVLIGAGTARADNPSLLARTEPPPERQPARAVVTSRLELSPDGALFQGLDVSPVILFSIERTGPARHAIFEAMGVSVVQVPRAGDGADISAVLSRLGELGFASVLVEGGGKLAASLLAASAVDRIEWFRAPIVLGSEGRPAVGELAVSQLGDAPRWRRVALRELGPDLWESYERV